jgi:hypothetical protein
MAAMAEMMVGALGLRMIRFLSVGAGLLMALVSAIPTEMSRDFRLGLRIIIDQRIRRVCKQDLKILHESGREPQTEDHALA